MSKWYEKTLEEKSNIIYSRIRLARNWDEYVFPSRLDEEGSRELVDGLKDGLKEIPYPYYALENMQQAEKKALRELKPLCSGKNIRTGTVPVRRRVRKYFTGSR